MKDINRAVWKAWPVLAVAIPILLLASMFLGRGGWGLLLLLITSPVWLSIVIVLDLLPFLLLRKLRPGASPTLMTCAMLLHWWGLAWLAHTMPDSSDGGPEPPLFAVMFPGVPDSALTVLFIVGWVLAIGGWIGALTAAITTRRQLKGEGHHSS